MTHDSILAYVIYTTIILMGLKLLGARLTWVMVFFPIWGPGILLVLAFVALAIIIGAQIR
ncbi:MAG: hypothetical protein V3S55_10100 [Nitrospiraceae bacterium]